MLSVLFSSPILGKLYLKLAEMRSKKHSKNDEEDSCYVYSPHGCFMIFTKDFIQKIDGYLYGESISLFSGNGRLEASLYLLQHWSESLMGGSYFTNQYGLQQHNMLFQIYDLYGIIPFIIVFWIYVLALKNMYILLCSDNAQSDIG